MQTALDSFQAELPFPFTREDKRFDIFSLANAAEGGYDCFLRMCWGELYNLQDRDGTRSNTFKLPPN